MTKPLTHPPSDTRALPASQRGAEIIDLVTRAGGSDDGSSTNTPNYMAVSIL